MTLTISKRILALLFRGRAPCERGPCLCPTQRKPRHGADVTTTARRKRLPSTSKKEVQTRAQTAPTPDRIREIQSALKREGAYQGEPTGKWDDATVEAMKKYQDKNGLNPTGKIDALTLNKLGLGSETAGKGAPSPLRLLPSHCSRVGSSLSAAITPRLFDGLLSALLH